MKSAQRAEDAHLVGVLQLPAGNKMRRILVVSAAISSAIVSSWFLAACSSDSSTSGAQTGDASADTSASPDTGPATQDAGPDAPGTPTLSCDTFCGAVMKNCTGANAAYPGLDECLVECGDMTPGSYGDSKNTLGCRQAHADLAAGDPAKNCGAAGSFGAGVCGDRCDGFCMQVINRCGGQAIVYNNEATCLSDCSTLFKFDPNQPELAPDGGNTLNCRMYQLKQILIKDPPMADLVTDCANAGPNSTVCK
jgi:hypothetical protein